MRISVLFIFCKSLFVALLTQPSSVSLSLKKGRERLKKAFSGGRGFGLMDVERLLECSKGSGEGALCHSDSPLSF
jgi:hypothetical protein